MSRSTVHLNGVRYSSSMEVGTITNSYHLVCNAFLDGQEVGICQAKLFIRDAFDRTALNFWKRMRGLRVQSSPYASSTVPTNESERLAFDLFDHYGGFRRKFYRHSIAKGKECWDSQLEQGTIVLAEKFHVEPNWRALNIETQIFQRLLEMATNREPGSQEESSKTKTKVGYWVFTRAGILHGPTADQRYTQQNSFRSLGFRRVGNSEWFAYCPDPNHRSRQLPAERDLGIPGQQTSALSEYQANLFTQVSSRSIPDARSVREIDSCLASPHTTEYYWLAATAKNGDTLLHGAAKAFKPDTVKYILLKRPNLAMETNGVGYTPYQVLEEEMEKFRFPFTDGIVEGGKVLRGPCPDEAEKCLEFLKQFTGGESILKYSE